MDAIRFWPESQRGKKGKKKKLQEDGRRKIFARINNINVGRCGSGLDTKGQSKICKRDNRQKWMRTYPQPFRQEVWTLSWGSPASRWRGKEVRSRLRVCQSIPAPHASLSPMWSKLKMDITNRWILTELHQRHICKTSLRGKKITIKKTQSMLAKLVALSYHVCKIHFMDFIAVSDCW